MNMPRKMSKRVCTEMDVIELQLIFIFIFSLTIVSVFL